MASKRKLSQLDVNGHLDNRTESTDGRTRTKNDKLRDLSRRFTKPTTAPDLDVSLCSRCRVIDLATVFASADAGDDLNAMVIANIDSLNPATIDSSCRLCSFLLCLTYDCSQFPSCCPIDTWKLCTFDSLTIRGFRETLKTITEPRSIVICLLPRSSGWIWDLTLEAIVVPVNRSYASTQRPSRFCYRGRQLCATSINYDLIKKWLQDCEGRHKRCRLETPRQKPIKVIDCLQRKIVSTAPNTKYFTLSYVWGALVGNIDTPKLSPGDEHLPDDIPRLIADAMTLVVSLGSKHLWVDRWCIDQGNKEETQQQVSCMDDIYEGAIATIVAFTSAAPDKGLSGVSVPRNAPPCVQISGDVYLEALYSVSYKLFSSEWNRRGWTYQEFCLSRRCLLIAEDQVHFFCRTGKTGESVEEAALSDQPFRFQRCLNPNILSRPADYAKMTPAEPYFLRHMLAYTDRVLSYDSDKLNAFRGILSRSKLASYWGVPVFRTDSAMDLVTASTESAQLTTFHQGFSLGLCWFAEPRAPCGQTWIKDNTSNREQTPSWSWVSNRSRINYHSSFYMQRKDDELWFDSTAIDAFAQVFLNDPSVNSQASIWEQTRSTRDRSLVIPERGQTIYIKSVVKPIPTCFWPQTQTLIVWDDGYDGYKAEDPGVTLAMILLISTKERTVRRSRCPSLKHYMVFSMTGDTARRVGIVRSEGSDETLHATPQEMQTIKVQ